MLIPMIVLAIAIVMIAVELRTPGRRWPTVAGWWTRAALLNTVQVGVVLLAGATWDRWLPDMRSWSADSLGTTGGAALGYVAITFVYYWWHRARHAIHPLWRIFHQVHHSPQRIEILTAFYKHPAEIAVNGVLTSIVLYPLCGLGPEAAVHAVLLTGLAELFYHWNVSTPRWVGYFLQRPESHCVHHQEGHHRQNYSDLPVWDMLFGTFHNPASWQGRCGFGTDEHELAAMLLGADVAAQESTSESWGDRRYAGTAVFLLGLGLAAMTGDGLQRAGLGRIGAGVAAVSTATGASPAPRVFTAVDGLETYSTRFVLEWTDTSGRPRELEITPERYRRLRGPYNRRNVYGAAMAYGPLLARDERSRGMLEEVARYALCGDAPLLTELGVDRRTVDGAVTVRLHPINESSLRDRLPLRLEGGCHA